jgi:hypothetical protein
MLKRFHLTLFLLTGLVFLPASLALAGDVYPGLIGHDLTDPDEDGVLNVLITAGGEANSPLAESPAMALDNAFDTKWLSFQPAGTFYQFEFLGNTENVRSYTITSANDLPERDPYSWIFEGSFDGAIFIPLDVQTEVDFTRRFQTQGFNVENFDGFPFYRFSLQTELGAGGPNPGDPNSIQIAEFELFSDPLPPPPRQPTLPTQSNMFLPNETSGFTVSDADLINGLSPSNHNYTPMFEGGPIENLTDGTTGDGNNAGSNVANAVFDRDHPFFAEYELDLAAAPNGYDLTEIVSVTGHHDNRTDQTFDILVRRVGSDEFVSLSEGVGFDYRPDLGRGAAKVSLTPSPELGPVLASGVDAVRFHNTVPGSVFRELDVFGEPTILDMLMSDLTGDGAVDFMDLTLLLANWNRPGVTKADGNLVSPDTTTVNFADLTFLLADWTGSAGAASPEEALAAEAIPEPSTAVLALLGMMGVLCCGRRKMTR